MMQSSKGSQLLSERRRLYLEIVSAIKERARLKRGLMMQSSKGSQLLSERRMRCLRRQGFRRQRRRVQALPRFCCLQQTLSETFHKIQLISSYYPSSAASMYIVEH